MAYKILFAGIDGSGKTSCLHALISRLDSKYRILKIGNCDPYLFFKGTKRLLVTKKFYHAINYWRIISLKYHFHGVFLIFNYLYKYVLSKYLETYKDTDLIIYESDTLLHPAVYVTYHFPWTKKLNARSRLRFVSTLFGSKKDFLIFYLDTDPDIAVDRIHKRNIDIQSHENRSDLQILKNEFDRVLKAASEAGLDIVRINTNAKGLEEVASEVEFAAKTKFHLAL